VRQIGADHFRRQHVEQRLFLRLCLLLGGADNQGRAEQNPDRGGIASLLGQRLVERLTVLDFRCPRRAAAKT
jgi:hypothetical protein